ncbi:uncharacterized protein B4U80_06877 [Leptotrombidium deliense]|uniref:Uncharacterized protein n=1 Tax=Leptotrombidium deliense TaxID=299467 RepID=A0A443SV56_9ACAR|nr:uncharacterized protein B4U80_06877 [Leptotrombidium deliense]
MSISNLLSISPFISFLVAFAVLVCRHRYCCFVDGEDGAFGRCTRSVQDEEKHSLNDDELNELEKEMKRLFNNGYRWDHQYTQCVIRQILYAYKHHLNYDPGLCSRLLKLTQPDIVSLFISYQTVITLHAFSPKCDYLFIASQLNAYNK